MPKRNLENLQLVYDAMNRFKEIQNQDPGDNPSFTESVKIALNYLSDKEHDELGKVLERARKPPNGKARLPENKGLLPRKD